MKYLLTLALLFPAIACAAGVAPLSKTDCPTSAPIKGNTTTRDGGCIAHSPGGQYYTKTQPERCYATMAAAEADGCRRPKPPKPPKR
jgi:hypothetical protein